MKRTLLSFLAILLPVLCMNMQADTLAEVDSLLKVHHISKGQARAAAGKRLLDIYAQAAVFFNDPPTLKAGDSQEQQDLKVWFGTERFYTTCSYYTEALAYNELAMDALTELGKEGKDLSDLYATLLCDKSYCLFKTSDYTSAIEVGQEAIRLCQQTQNWMQLSRAYLYIAIVNHSLRKYDEAKSLVVKAIEVNERLGVNVQTHNALGIACEIFCSAMEVDKAIDYGKRAVEAARQIGYEPGVANHLTQLSYAYDRKGDYQKGLDVADQAIAIVKATEPLDRNQLALCLEYKSWNLIDIGRQREAADALREAISLQQEVGNTHAVWYDYRTLAEALEAYDPHESIAMLKRYVRMGDSIHSEQLKELMSHADAEFHNSELKDQNSQLEIINAQTRRMNRIILWSALIVTLMLVVAIVSLWIAFRQKKRTAAAQQRMTEAREAFFTNVTHELRTPLTVILGLGHELQEQTAGSVKTADLHEKGAAIERQGSRLLALMNEMLDISKVKSALGRPTPTTGDLSAYVEMMVESHRELARQKHITISYETDKKGIYTQFVADYMDKMVGNLLSNAVKYTPEGGNVRVTLHRQGSEVQLVIADTGQGIPAEDLPHIYDIFYRSDKAEGEGTGVGLALVKQIVDTLKGTIDVKSSPGQGTAFTIMMNCPVVKAPKAMTHKTEDEATIVLVVDDNDDVAHLIGRQLRGNYQVYYAANGQEGLEQARALLPDLIITDLMMPLTDGLELCRNIRADEDINHIPVIMVTAKVTEEDRVKGLEAGADAYLFKPFNADELNVRVEKLLEMRQMLREKYGTAQAGTRKRRTNIGRPQAFAIPSELFYERVRESIERLMPTGKCGVDDIGEDLHISVSHLRRKIHSVMGMSPKEFIMKVRMEAATELLENHPEYTIAYIASQCGFYDESHFIRTYSAMFGVTPGKVIRQKLEKQ